MYQTVSSEWLLTVDIKALRAFYDIARARVEQLKLEDVSDSPNDASLQMINELLTASRN